MRQCTTRAYHHRAIAAVTEWRESTSGNVVLRRRG
jgi:hypothetical protein